MSVEKSGLWPFVKLRDRRPLRDRKSRWDRKSLGDGKSSSAREQAREPHVKLRNQSATSPAE
jgi:hypothetical protein